MTILVDPLPRTLAMICDAPTRARLEALGPLVVHEDGPMPDELVERHLPETVAILGQTAMPKERLDRAPNLRAIVNVEGNFLPNVDYAACLDAACTCSTPARRSRCRWPRPRSAWRSTSRAGSRGRPRHARRDGDLRAGEQRDAFLLAGSPVGIVGFGDLGRELRRLLAPFGNPVKVHDPGCRMT